MKGFYSSTFLLVAFFFSTGLTKSNPCRYVQHNKYINDPSSCKAYFKCVDGKAVPGNCPKDYWFDKYSGECGYQSEVECEGAGSEEDPCKDNCNGVDPCFVNNPATCVGYFYCKNGEAIPGECENGQVFSPDENKCVYPKDYHCEDSTTGGITKDNVCNNVPNLVLVRNPQDCAKYHICVNGKAAVDADCKDGALFNLKTGTCDSKDEVDCEVHEDIKPDCKDKDNVYVADPKSCAGYYHCKNNQAVSHGNCPAEQWFYEDKCEWTLKVPETVCKNRCEGTKGKRFVVALDKKCKSYYPCLNGKINGGIQECEPNTLFDIEIEHCVPEGGTYTCPIA